MGPCLSQWKDWFSSLSSPIPVGEESLASLVPRCRGERGGRYTEFSLGVYLLTSGSGCFVLYLTWLFGISSIRGSGWGNPLRKVWFFGSVEIFEICSGMRQFCVLDYVSALCAHVSYVMAIKCMVLPAVLTKPCLGQMFCYNFVVYLPV